MGNKNEMPAGEKIEKFLYTYPSVCMYCKKPFKINKTNEERMAGQPSHGICDKCMKEKYPEESKENKE